MKITRREFALGSAAFGAAVLALGGAMAAINRFPQLGLDLVRPARADEPSVPIADLMQPNPLGEMAMGDEKAPITVIEYASMTCPHCAHFSEATFPELKKRYIDTGKVRFLFREFPLDQLAAAGFVLARCAGPDKYFPLIETLFAQQHDWVVQKPLQPLLAIAKQAGLSQQAFEACLDNREMLEKLEKVRNDASDKFGVNSTPTFFVNGKRLAGALSIEEMEKEFAPYLKG
ncbi:MAG TPA: DsbA family protein [Xanthobacteraceae bacterium]